MTILRQEIKVGNVYKVPYSWVGPIEGTRNVKKIPKGSCITIVHLEKTTIVEILKKNDYFYRPPNKDPYDVKFLFDSVIVRWNGLSAEDLNDLIELKCD